MPIIAGRASAAYGAGFSRVVTAPYLGPFGAYDALASTVVGSTSVANITFSNIPSGYEYLEVRYAVKSARTGTNALDELNLRFNGDTGSNYSQRALLMDANSAALTANAAYPSTNIELGSGMIGDSVSNSEFGVGIFTVIDYASFSKYKNVVMVGGVNFTTSVDSSFGRVGTGSGAYFNFNPITSLTLYADNGNLVQYSQISLYGVK
jgi:hypothetical protein